MSIAGMHDKTVDEDEDFDSIAPRQGTGRKDAAGGGQCAWKMWITERNRDGKRFADCKRAA